jgi:molecular chaperone GrpE
LPNEPSKEKQGEDENPSSIKNIRDKLDALTKEKEESEKKAADYLDRLKRLQADMENLQKITKRQVDTVTRQASERLLVNLLPVLDALQHAGKLSKSSDSMRTDEVSVGLKMLYEQLADILFAEGLEEIPTVGHLLDPDRHEVVGYSETDDTPENTVIEEVRKGYSLNGKVIRPSLVIVSRAGRREVEPEEEEGGVAD